MKIKHLVIPAAGLGTRLMDTVPGLPANFPKEMLPVGRKPALQYALAEAYDAGIRDFTIIIRQGKGIIHHFIDRREYPGGLPMESMNELNTILDNSTVHFRYQEKLTGECGAMALARDVVGDAPFAVMYPDNIPEPTPGIMRALIEAYDAHGLDTVCLSDVPKEIKHCVSDSGHVDLEDHPTGLQRVTNFLPKGESWFEPRCPGERRICGIYAASPRFLDTIERLLPDLPQREELTDGKVRRAMLDKGAEFLALPVEQHVHDMGNPEGFWRCAQAFYEPPA